MPYTAFASKKGKAITARLIVRRVKDLNRKAAAGQDELFTIWRYHALFTDSPFEMIQAEAQHRDHAIVEQVFADLASGPVAHLPSGHFPANAAWLALAAICHNLTRAAGCLAGAFFAKARSATIRSQLTSVAARIARHGRGHITLHLPEGWHHETGWPAQTRSPRYPRPQRPPASTRRKPGQAAELGQRRASHARKTHQDHLPAGRNSKASVRI